MNIIIYSRLYILYLLFNCGGWIYFGFLDYYIKFITSDNCNYNINEFNVIKILVGITMGITTSNLINATIIFKNFESYNNINSYIDTFFCPLLLVFIFLSTVGSIGLSIFIKTLAMTSIICSDNNAFFGIKLSVYGVMWIAIIELFCIIYIILLFLYNIILDSKLHLLFLSCKEIYNKYKHRRIGIDNNNINQISIPITALKERNKILCSICYDSSISLLLEPCNHICICELCYNLLVTNNCPICKKEILSTKKIYLVNYNE
jgi:hypothetical protein